jgi:hypothetical protein
VVVEKEKGFSIVYGPTIKSTKRVKKKKKNKRV